jgi:uroporphyrinogen III methyltransferase/synthase
VEAFSRLELAGRRVLFPRADKAREVIPQGLAALGAEVVAPIAYRNIVPETFPAEALAALQERHIDCITFTASSTVENLAAMLGPQPFRELLAGVTVASIGPITSATCRRLGLEVQVEPAEYTLDALVQELVRHFQASGTGSPLVP